MAATGVDITQVGSVERAGRVAPRRRRAAIIAAVVLAAVAAGGSLASAGPTADELEHAHWQAVADYHAGLYQAQVSEAASEAAYWQQVVEYHEARWAQR